MRHVLLLDNKISTRDLRAWQKDDDQFWQTFIGMTPTYEIIRKDFSDYPTYEDDDGDIRPEHYYLQSLNNEVVKTYGDYGTDFIMMLVHEDNWQSDPDGPGGIWGTNYSYAFGKQHFQYCRWSPKPVNTFGTLYHERAHSFDALTLQEIGIDIRPLLGVTNFDREVVHGYNPDWEYIRWKENTDMLKTIAPHLRKAFSVREQKHNDFITGQQTIIIKLAQELLYLLKMRLNRKYDVSKSV